MESSMILLCSVADKAVEIFSVITLEVCICSFFDQMIFVINILL